MRKYDQMHCEPLMTKETHTTTLIANLTKVKTLVTLDVL
jgi:hypothetical protein